MEFLVTTLKFPKVTWNVYLTYMCAFCKVLALVQSIPTESTFNLSLSGYNLTNNAIQTFDEMIVADSNTTIEINVTELPQSPAEFIIFQVHSHKFRVILSYNATLRQNFYVNGTNVGLYYDLRTSTKTTFFVVNTNNVSLSLFISAHVYRTNAPVPGGCNMEFFVEIAPYQKLSYTNEIIVVDVQPASSVENACEKQHISYEMYHMFLNEQDFSPEAYFEGIQRMMTIPNIRQYGRKVGNPIEGSQMRRIYSAYPGVGEIFVVIATHANSSAVYVPIVTYACNDIDVKDPCGTLPSTFLRVLAAAAFFMGLFTCFFGHKFFKTGTFLLGLLAGGLLSYIIISMLDNESFEANILNSTLIGGASGLLWLTVWSYFGIPILQVTLATLLLGFIFASITFYSGLADIQIFQSDLNFWFLFVTILFSVSTVLSPMLHRANILAFCILGAYCVVIMIDHYIGANLKYIIVNIIRRATLSTFNVAVIDPPYQFRDMGLTLVWLFLAMSGYALQHHEQRGKPPFPPPPYSQRGLYRSARHPARTPAMSPEREPLLPRLLLLNTPVVTITAP